MTAGMLRPPCGTVKVTDTREADMSDSTNRVNVWTLRKGDTFTIASQTPGKRLTMTVVMVYDDRSLADHHARTVLANVQPDASGYGITLRPDNVDRHDARMS
jgi:hypothetical protein